MQEVKRVSVEQLPLDSLDSVALVWGKQTRAAQFRYLFGELLYKHGLLQAFEAPWSRLLAGLESVKLSEAASDSGCHLQEEFVDESHLAAKRQPGLCWETARLARECCMAPGRGRTFRWCSRPLEKQSAAQDFQFGSRVC